MRRLFIATVTAFLVGSAHAASVDDARLEHWLQAAERELAQTPANAAKMLRIQIAMNRLERRAPRQMSGEGDALAHLRGDDCDKARALASVLRFQAGDEQSAAEITRRITSDSNRQKVWAVLCARAATFGRMAFAQACFDELTEAEMRSDISSAAAQWSAFRGELTEADVWAKRIVETKEQARYERLRRAVTLFAKIDETAAAVANETWSSELLFCLRAHVRERAAAGDAAGARALARVCPAGDTRARAYLAVGDGQIRAGDKSGAAATAELARAQAERLPADNVFRSLLLAFSSKLFREADMLDAALITGRNALAAEIAFVGADLSPRSAARPAIIEALVRSDQWGQAATTAGSGQNDTFVLACVGHLVRKERYKEVDGFIETLEMPAHRARAWLKAVGEMSAREWKRDITQPS